MLYLDVGRGLALLEQLEHFEAAPLRIIQVSGFMG